MARLLPKSIGATSRRRHSPQTSQLCRCLKRSCIHNGTLKGHRRVEPPDNDSDKKRNKEQEGLKREGKKGARRARRDDAIHSRDEGGGIHVSLVIPSSLSQSLVSPALDVPTVWRFLLPATLSADAPIRDTPLPDRIETWSPLFPSLSLFPGAQRRGKIL